MHSFRILTMRVATAAVIACGGNACARREPAANDDAKPGAVEGADVALARAIADDRVVVPPRAEALTLAESIEARAVREGAGARAAELHATAARLLARVWRVEGHEQDAREALELYRSASRDSGITGACRAAYEAALLSGEVSHDASTTYGELYRVQRRFATQAGQGDGGAVPSCSRSAEGALALLAAFRPTQRVLDAIDDGVIGEGTIALALASAASADAPTESAPPRVTRIEAWPGRDATRVVVVVDRPVAYRVGDDIGDGPGAPRVYLALDGVDLGAPVARDTPSQGVVTRIRAEATSTGSRVSLDLDGRAWRRVFYMREPYRIVIDVARHPPGVQGRGSRVLSRIVLDAGHGGKDTGAVGPTGIREKDVTLDVARKVAPVLAAQGVVVVLTRDEDQFVSLEERTARANSTDADLFVSIHCNASESRGRRGVETYVLDTTRDEIAARVAARENATTQAAGVELASILGGMRLADQAQRSTRFAQLLQRAAAVALRASYGDVVDGGVHAAGFYVLVGARMPSVLFETSYLSNGGEEQRLSTVEYRQLLADSIVNAVRAYREGR